MLALSGNDYSVKPLLYAITIIQWDVRKGIRVRSRNRAGSPRRGVIDAMDRNSSGNVRESRVGRGGKYLFCYRTGNFFFEARRLVCPASMSMFLPTSLLYS